MAKVLTIYCTELAALAGRHQYRTVEQAVDGLLCHNEQVVYATMPHLRARLRGCRIAEAASRREEFACRKRHADALESGLAKLAKAESVGDVRQIMDDTLTDIDDPKERDAVRGLIYKTRGLTEENGAMDAYEKLTGRKLTERNTAFRVSKAFTTKGGVTYKIGGRLDGVCDDLGRLVEVKNRVSKFHIPEYDRIQVMGYFAITGLTQCEFIQCLCGELRVDTLQYDEDAWESVRRAFEGALDRYLTPEAEEPQSPPSAPSPPTGPSPPGSSE